MDARGIAVVTGASRGIGRAVALELAARGFDVVATMRDPSAGSTLADEHRGPGSVTVARLDVDDASTIVIPDGTRVLVNNAGVEDENLPLEHLGDDVWRRMFETNVFGVARVTRAAVPVLRASGGGVICNVTSSSLLAPVPFLAAYRASKAAVSALGESLAAEVQPFGIRVVEVMPGPVETDMLARSDRPTAAIGHPEYRETAERLWATRQSVRAHHTPAPDAAREVADAILDDDAPLRVGCDPMSVGMLGAWRAAADDESWFRSMLRAFLAE
jgi:NAD(P)-dependent dehydrogenase (short-subunit alcohol dehydrogenase family)